MNHLLTILHLMSAYLLLRWIWSAASSLWRTLRRSIQERRRQQRHRRLFPAITKVALSFLTPYPEYLGQPDSRTFSERLLSKPSGSAGNSPGR